MKTMMPRPLPPSPLRRRSLAAFAMCSTCLVLQPIPGLAQQPSPTPFVIGTPRPEDTVVGHWLRLVYIEAFRRMAIPVRFEVHPVRRLGPLLDGGELDLETVRGRDFANDLPNVVRVNESVFDPVPAIFVVDPSLQLKRLEDLKTNGWRGAYPRGLVECERPVGPLLSAERFIDVGLTEQAVKMLLSGRVEFVCGLDFVVLAIPQTPEYKGMETVRKLINAGETVPLYPHLNRRHAALAPVLAATLKQMKTEGLVERYRQDSLRKFAVN
jgi:polar amino acid transport system substrate-binding protein